MATQIKKATYGPLTVNPDDSAGVMITFPDGTRAEAAIEQLPAEVVTRLAVHGLSQKLGDSYASAAKQENPLGWAKGRVKEVLEQLLAGDWRVTAEGGPSVTLLGRALARAMGKTTEEAMEVLNAKQDELDNGETKQADNPWKAWQAELGKQPAIKKAKADIKLEDAKAAAEKDVGEQTTDLGALFE